MNQTWEQLPKNIADNSTIDQAIDAKIVDHNNDVAAHLGTDQALQSHRANEIIDHLAESVVNDKLKASARTFVAIVDPASVADFDTLQGAVAEAVAKGGGTILLTPGTYYIAGVCEIPMSVNLYALDAESVTVHGSVTAGDYIKLIEDTATGQVRQTIENITFTDDGGGVIKGDTTSPANDNIIEFNFCNFTGGDNFIHSTWYELRLNRCKFICDAGPAVVAGQAVRAYECYITDNGTTGTSIFVEYLANGPEVCIFYGYDCRMQMTTKTTKRYFSDATEFTIHLYNCQIVDWAWTLPYMVIRNMQNCTISGKTNTNLTISSGGEGGTIVYNTILAYGTGYVTSADTLHYYTGNSMTGALTNFDNAVNYRLPAGIAAYEVVSTSTTALNMATSECTTLTPNSTRTLTTTVPRAGSLRMLIIMTSGTTTYTLTFGTGFKTTGTLATGTTSARYFTLLFVSNGTHLIQISRSTAMA